MPSTAVPLLLRDPGYLFWAPVLTTLPAECISTPVSSSKFQLPWPVAWISLGATEDGTEFSYTTKMEMISAAEFFDPLAWATTERSGQMAFNLLDYTAKNISRAFNGMVLTTLAGAGTTLVTKGTLPSPGNEVRAMLGWESQDGTMRVICYQTINSGEIKTSFKKAPAKASLPCSFNFEVPTSAPQQPCELFWAGATRLGV